MWIAKFKIKHDCMFLNRCVRFAVNLQSIPLTVFKIRGKTFTSSLHHASGGKDAINAFISDLKKEKGVVKLERKGDTFFIVERTETQAIQFYVPTVFFVKPVLMSQDGYETWEIASWEKNRINKVYRKHKQKGGPSANN